MGAQAPVRSTRWHRADPLAHFAGVFIPRSALAASCLAASWAIALAGPASPPSQPAPYRYTAPAPARLGVLAPQTGIAVGQPVPEVTGTDLEGREVSLASLYHKGPLLLAFYRGGWCPYCNSEIRALTDAYPKYRKRGITPVAISVDRPQVEADLNATYTIPFPVLSDSDAVIIEAFHVVNAMSTEQLEQMTKWGVNLESYSGTAHHKIAIPALFLVDRKGIVRWAHSDPDYKVRPTTEQILSVIDAHRSTLR